MLYKNEGVERCCPGGVDRPWDPLGSARAYYVCTSQCCGDRWASLLKKHWAFSMTKGGITAGGYRQLSRRNVSEDPNTEQGPQGKPQRRWSRSRPRWVGVPGTPAGTGGYMQEQGVGIWWSGRFKARPREKSRKLRPRCLL